MSEGAEQPVCFFCRLDDGPFHCRTNGALDKRRLAENFLEQYRADHGPNPDPQRSEDLWWAWECLNHLTKGAPDSALDVILLALPLLRGDSEVAYLAAGPLEDLIAQNGALVIERIEAEASGNLAFCYLLSGIWPLGNENTEVWRRVQRAVKDGPWLDEDPRTPQGTAGYTKRK
jgi:hypothetical protein